jgi:serine/threonine protein kinase
MSDTPEPPSACEAVTDALGNRYEILAELGEGSFGTVYKANDTALNRIVAVKSVRLDNSSDPALREEMNKRFLREAQVAAQLNHPNIVTIHDIISTPSTSLIVMEFVEGVSLRSVLETKRRLPLSEALGILSQVAEALDYAHERKVIHRDVKPANIMIIPPHEVRVTDFGIAKTESSGDLTLGGTILGTPDYMSPEQARAVPVDGRSDLFSLGSVLYECLVGEKPFRGGTVTGVLLRIVSDDPAPEVDWTGLGLPAELDKVMNRALAKDPSERYPTGAALIEALRSLLPAEESSEAGATDAEDKEPPSPTSQAEAMSSMDVEEIVHPEVSSETKEQAKTSPTEPSYIRTLREEERVLCFSTEDPNILQDLNLSPYEAYLVSRIDGTLKPRDFFAVSPLDERETARTLLGLIEARVIKFKAKDSPLSNEAEQEETPVVTKSSTKGIDRESAEEIYIRAERAYENQDYWTAIELCRHAISVSDKEAKYHHLLGLALFQNENWRKEAEESLRRATELDPDNSEYFEALGSLYQQAGLSSRAQQMFDKAKSNSN